MSIRQTKYCNSCRRRKPIRAFAHDRSKSDGRKSRCRTCDYHKHAQWQKTNREHVAAYARQRRAALRSLDDTETMQ